MEQCTILYVHAGGGEYGGVYQETNGQSGLQIGGRDGDKQNKLLSKQVIPCMWRQHIKPSADR